MSTPVFRGLQFAVTDGEGLLQRETVDDDPRHIEPLAPGVSARVEPRRRRSGRRRAATAAPRAIPGTTFKTVI